MSFFLQVFHSQAFGAQTQRRHEARCESRGAKDVSVATLLLALSACSGPVPVSDAPMPEADAGAATNSTETESSTDTTGTDTTTAPDEPVEEVYTCGEVNSVPYEGRLLTRAQYQNTVTDLFGGRVQGEWVANFPAENEVGGFRTNAESHRATSWLAEAHLTAAEAISAEVKQNLNDLAPCATVEDLATPSTDAALQNAAESCARTFLSTYGFRAFRRPLAAAEEQPLLALFAVGYQESGAPYGLELMTQALLLSPQFLYRIEAPTTVVEPGSDGELVDGFGLASRLSYLLWNSMPDEELLAVAQSGTLEQPEVLRAQAERLLDSPKAHAAIEDFAEQWLGLGALNGAVRRIPEGADSIEETSPDVTSTDSTTSDTSSTDSATNTDTSTATVDSAPTSDAASEHATSDALAATSDSNVDPTDAPTSDASNVSAVDTSASAAPVATAPSSTTSADTDAPGAEQPASDANNQFSSAWRASLVEFVSNMYAEDATFASLMLSKEVYVNAQLAELYGTEFPADESGFVGVEFPDAERAGLLTQPGLMAMLAHSDQSAPILRGVFVLDALLCQPPPPAPASVDTTPPALDPNATTRERFLQHTVDPACSGCHMFIDPIGLGLENYDELGRFRDNENGLEVDASGELIGLRDVPSNGTFDGAVDLATHLSTSAQALGCFVSKWYQYGSGRGEKARDLCTINALKASFQSSGGNLRELLVAFVLSDAFRYRTLEAPLGEP